MFLSFEGGEGAGKTTLIRSLQEAFLRENKKVLLTREPGGSLLGERLREMLLEEWQGHSPTPMAELLLFLASRVQHLHEVILPALKRGEIVLCDRFHDSTVAYQGAGRGLGVERVRVLCLEVCEHIVPDLTFYLDVDPKIGLERSFKRSNFDRMEKEELAFHQKIRDTYLAIQSQEPERVYLIDATQSAQDVFSEVLQILTLKSHLTQTGE